jgi:hypothetical protein
VGLGLERYVLFRSCYTACCSKKKLYIYMMTPRGHNTHICRLSTSHFSILLLCSFNHSFRRILGQFLISERIEWMDKK